MKLQTILLTLSALFVLSINANAQDSLKNYQSTEVKSLNKLRLNVLGVAYEREQKIGRITTAYIGAGAEMGFVYEHSITYDDYNGFNAETETKTYFFPTIYAGLRHYYNLEKRTKKYKKTINNNGGYVGVDVSQYISTQQNTTNQTNIIAQWGFQTFVGKKVNFELNLGPGVALGNEQAVFTVGAKLGFSFLL